MRQQGTDLNMAKMQEEGLLVTSSTTKPPPLWCSKRFLVVVLMFLGFVNSNFLNFNISIAIVEMTSIKRIDIENSTVTRPPEFEWDSSTIGLVFSMFNYGGLLSFLGGHMVSKLGGANNYALSLMTTGVTTLLHPISLYYSFPVFLVIRFLTGIFNTFALVSVIDVCSKWIPKNERSKLMSLVGTGYGVGSVLVQGVGGYLIQTWGWAMIFHMTGTTSMMLSLLSFVLVKNDPSKDKLISEAELRYFQQQQMENSASVSKKNVEHSYRNILTSAPIWALLAVTLTHAWVINSIGAFFPLYIKDVTGHETDKVGILSSIPDLSSILATSICGMLLDYIGKKNISVTLTHKVVICGSYIFDAFLLSIVTVVSNFTVSMISFSFTIVLLNIVALVSNVIVISTFPNSAGVVASIKLLVNSISGIISRIATGYMTTHRSLQEWDNCFILSSVFFILGAMVFGFYGSSEPQPPSITSISNIHEDDVIQKNENGK